MAVAAYFEMSGEALELGRPPRLRFGELRGKVGLPATVHAISANTVLIEANVSLEVGARIDVRLPHAGSVDARVAWASERLASCQFDTSLSPATLSAAALKGAVVPEDRPRAARIGEVSESLGDRLQRLRTRAGLTQAEVAAALGVSEPSVSAWELDKSRPLAGRLDALASILEVKKTELLGYEEASANSADIVARCRAAIAAAFGVHETGVKISIEI